LDFGFVILDWEEKFATDEHRCTRINAALLSASIGVDPWLSLNPKSQIQNPK
jgi:hypothetical protein